MGVNMNTAETHQRKPAWLKVKLPGGENYSQVRRLARDGNLHTVCEDARCPNIAECWNRKTATFMILGDICTRACGFCSVKSGRPTLYDLDEPRRTAQAVRELEIRHAVITSVNRDDLPDGGAGVFAETIRQIREISPGTRVEVLIPDFQGTRDSLEMIWQARPDVLAHNVETVIRLQERVRSRSSFECSVGVLCATHKAHPEIKTKTGIQVGHGETLQEILEVMDLLAEIPLDILTIGQYLQPTKDHLPVKKYYHPDEFTLLKEEARSRGIATVQSGPLVRSSYHAEEVFSGQSDVSGPS